MPAIHNVLIITGSAPCLEADINALAFPDHVQCDWMAVGLDGVDKYRWPIDYVVTYHPAEIPAIRERRTVYGSNTNYKVISHLGNDGVDIVEPFVPPTGSSALCGALAAIRMGYKRIVLCGCPLLDTKYIVFQRGWESKKSMVQGIVKSMSGWTRELLGEPTQEWLGG
ncbi:MAG TPA: hypothetical protein DDY86_02605 [Syntrophaceae bacterium]|nr:hypothetical protein [Syntrophaceae bacterium]